MVKTWSEACFNEYASRWLSAAAVFGFPLLVSEKKLLKTVAKIMGDAKFPLEYEKETFGEVTIDLYDVYRRLGSIELIERFEDGTKAPYISWLPDTLISAMFLESRSFDEGYELLKQRITQMRKDMEC